ncbi:hypothetical protein JTB14_005053 [Gonioctena quinquepunctata]|nr:hypothetical protein JTB14_005053 [Gonioctena quinquepunctata]
MLQKKFDNSNFVVIQAIEDSDTLIVNTPISMSASFDSELIVGEDIDLLVLLTALARSHPNVYLRKSGRGKIVEEIYSPRSLECGEIVADSGCETTSAIFHVGNIKYIKTLKFECLSRAIQAFKE